MFDWTDEHIEIMQTMLTENKTSGRIAAALSAKSGIAVSRNAVIGKIHRMPHLRELAAAKHRPRAKPGPQSPKGMGWVKKPFEKQAKVNPPKPIGSGEKRPLPVFKGEIPIVGRPLLLLKGGMCRWAVNEAEKDSHLFCGAPTEHDRTYCERHRAMAHRPLPPRRKP